MLGKSAEPVTVSIRSQSEDLDQKHIEFKRLYGFCSRFGDFIFGATSLNVPNRVLKVSQGTLYIVSHYSII